MGAYELRVVELGPSLLAEGALLIAPDSFRPGEHGQLLVGDRLPAAGRLAAAVCLSVTRIKYCWHTYGRWTEDETSLVD